MTDEKSTYQPVQSTDESVQAYVAGPRKAGVRSLVARVGTVVAVLLLLGTHVLLSTVWHSGRSCHGGGMGAANQSIEARVERILASTPLIDGHNDFAIAIRVLFNNHINDPAFRRGFETDGLPHHVDLPRLRAGRNGGAFWSVFTPCPANTGDFSDATYATSVRDTLQQIDVMARLRDAYPAVFAPADLPAASARAAFARGQLISPLGVEGLHQIGNAAANLRRYYALGVRYTTLTHNCPNRYADAALWEAPLRKAPPFWGGLSPAGRKLVLEMNRLGMIVDLAHTSVDTMVDVLGGATATNAAARAAGWTGSRAPVIFSHSSAYSVCPHPRNVPDDVLRLVQKQGGLVMVNFSPEFVSCEAAGGENGLPTFYPPNSTLEHVATHVLHIGRLIGFDHVGLGSDFDGIPSTPRGLDDVAAFPALVAELLRRGVTDAEAAQIVGGNLLRVWQAVEDVAAQLQNAGTPTLEDDLPKFEELESLRNL